jgi:histidinol-phosphatase
MHISSPTSADLRTFLNIALEAAYAGGKRTLAYFNAGLASAEVEEKPDESPVTRADKEAELVIRDIIARYCPTHSILGEEHGRSPGDPRYTWVVDPIDGTKSFIHGVPLYGAVVGLIIDDKPMVGAVYLPPLNELYGAATGLGATMNGRACRVSSVARVEDAVLMSSSITRAIDRSDAYVNLARRVKLNRGWGDVFGYMLVASGRAEIMLDPRISLWDIAGVAPIIREAGGRIGTWAGLGEDAGVRAISGPDCVATNAALSAEVLSVLKDERRNA